MSDKQAGQVLLICNCQNTMQLDGAALSKALCVRSDAETGPNAEPGTDTSTEAAASSAPIHIHSELCRSERGQFDEAAAQCAKSGQTLHVACTQEAPLFRDVIEDKGLDDLSVHFSNIRERAGWCDASARTTPKTAALLKDAAYQSTPAPITNLNADGTCVVYGKGQAAIDAAQKLAPHLNVILLLSDARDIILPAALHIPVRTGHIKSAQGALGSFQITIDGYAAMQPSSRDALQFSTPRDGVIANSALLFDMSGGTPLLSAHKHRDGYLHVDPNHRAALAEAMFEIIDYVGDFEKPRYVSYKADLCAHARSGQIGCTNCLDHCPAGALQPDNDHIKVNADLCGGCGNCSAMCPTGAISYAFAPRLDVIKRVQALLHNYTQAGGTTPSLLLHDERHGSAMISAMARFGRGLPPSMIPLSLYSVFQIGHELLSAIFSAGAQHICVLAPPEQSEDLPALQNQTALSETFLKALGFDHARLHILTAADPQALETALYELETMPDIASSRFDPIGTKRDIARAALAKLHAAAPAPADVIELTAGAPYGQIAIDTAACTLCLSCVGACPAGALSDNAERPEVAFTESACVQCGVCRTTCPENAITLIPRYDFTNKALERNVLHSEDPFKCIACGKPFGTKSSVELIVEKLKDHPMFKQGDQIKLIQMCDDCRIVTQANANKDPLGGGARPLVRTTDDYLKADADAAAAETKSAPGTNDRGHSADNAGNKPKSDSKPKSGLKDPDDFLS